MQDPDTRGSVAWLFFWVIAGIWILRRRAAVMEGVENWVWQRAPNVRWRARLLPWAQRLVAISEPAFSLAFVAIAFQLVDEFIQSPELAVVEVLILAVLGYRVVVAALYHELAGLRRSPILRKRVQRDLRMVGRAALVLVILLGAAARLVGVGTLYAYLGRLSLLVSVVLIVILLRRWKSEIQRMHRERYPDTRLTQLFDEAKGVREFGLTIAGGRRRGRAWSAIRLPCVGSSCGSVRLERRWPCSRDARTLVEEPQPELPAGAARRVSGRPVRHRATGRRDALSSTR